MGGGKNGGEQLRALSDGILEFPLASELDSLDTAIQHSPQRLVALIPSVFSSSIAYLSAAWFC